MTLWDDQIRLNACLELPETTARQMPLVIVMHGFTGHMEERHILAAARACREAGYASLRFDFYGHGNSDGTFAGHTLYKWLSNALCVIHYARSLEFVSELYLCGHSQGGLVAMLAAAMTGDLISGLIPLSPAWMIPDGTRRGELLGMCFDPFHIPERVRINPSLELEGDYIRVAQTIYPEPAMDRYTGPVLIIHGQADTTVPFRYAEEAAKRYQNCTLVPIPGDTHCFDLHLEQMTQALRNWLRSRQ